MENRIEMKHLALGVLVFAVLVPVFCGLTGFVNLQGVPLNTPPQHEMPMQEATEYFERKSAIVSAESNPIQRNIHYYWYEPENVQENTEYPLVLILHGSTGYAYAGKFLTQGDTAEHYPAFILVPMIPKLTNWGQPRTTIYPQILPYVVSLISDLKDEYPIDPSRIYVVGCSMGGHGVFGASEYYSDVFAAGVSISGGWDVKHADKMGKMPMLIMGGTHDTLVPIQRTREMATAMEEAGASIEYAEYEIGHNCPSPVFYEDRVWEWLFAQ